MKHRKYSWSKVGEAVITQVVRVEVAVEVHQFSRRVHRRLREQGITLIDLARKMGVGLSTLSKKINSSEVNEVDFARISAALGMTPVDWHTDLPSGYSAEDGYALVTERHRRRVSNLRATLAPARLGLNNASK